MTDVLADFAARFTACWLCGATHAWPGLEIHHIARGVNRAKSKNVWSTLIRTCPCCHEKHLDGMPVVRQLAIKRLYDPEGYDRREVNLLRRRAAESITEAEVSAEVEELGRMIRESSTHYPYTRT